MAKAKALVKQLGGLSFTLINFGGLYDTISSALAQSWKACGINAQVSTVTGPALEQAFATGGFQMAFTVEGGLSSPIFYRSFQQQGTPQGAYTTVPLHSDIPGLVSQLYETTEHQPAAVAVHQPVHRHQHRRPPPSRWSAARTTPSAASA